jgi:hypothetical protein
MNNMFEPEALDPLIQSLRNLPPAPHALSRERLLFEAGRAAGTSQQKNLWKKLAMTLGATTAGLLAVMGLWISNNPRNAPETSPYPMNHLYSDVASSSGNKTVQGIKPPAQAGDDQLPEVRDFSAQALAAIKQRQSLARFGEGALPDSAPAREIAMPDRPASSLDTPEKFLQGVLAIPAGPKK